MKRSLQILSLIMPLILGLGYVACTKSGYDPNSPEAVHQREVDALKALSTPIVGRFWKIHSISQGGAFIAIDSCNSQVTYEFDIPNLDYAQDAGNVYINFNNSPCPRYGSGRNQQPQHVTYIITANPGTITFPDNGYDLKNNSYNVLKGSRDSLVLQSQAIPTIIKIYLAEK